MKVKKIGCVQRDAKRWDGNKVVEEVTTYACGNYKITTIHALGEPEEYTRILPRREQACSRFLPEIIHYADFTGQTMGCFKISTVSYGSLYGYEYDYFLKACAHAGKVADALTDYFIKGVR